ncbi:MAG: uroporphyrinogen decarboxylase [Acidimicrobiia bacterium]
MGAKSHRFLSACRGEQVDRTPIWLMRQAGRYLPEYQEVRAKHSLLEICKTPELAAKVTLQPLERFDLDAAIVFADILLPLEAMGAPLEFTAGEGPVIRRPVRDRAGVDDLVVVAPEALGFVAESVRLASRALAGSVPLIGFAGAPFTLASYLVEGGASRTYALTKALMFRDPDTWHALLAKLAAVVSGYLGEQARAGAQALQLFDSWVGCLAPEDYARYVLPHVRSVFEALRPHGVPLIHFGTGTGSLLPLMRQAGGDVIGLDWRVELDEAWGRLGYDVAVQGNLDPTVLLGPVGELEERVDGILRRAGGRPGHVFNLGHGVLPETPIDNVAALVALVHERSRRS